MLNTHNMYKMINIAPKVKDELLEMQANNEINSGSELVNAYGKGLITPQAYKQHLKRLNHKPKSYTWVYVLSFLFLFGSIAGAHTLEKHHKLPKALKFLLKK